MICAKCVEQGLRSTIKALGGSTTAMCGWEGYDEDGVYHRHDPNIGTDQYRCSNGHSWSEERLHRCPVEGCDFNERRAKAA